MSPGRRCLVTSSTHFSGSPSDDAGLLTQSRCGHIGAHLLPCRRNLRQFTLCHPVEYCRNTGKCCHRTRLPLVSAVNFCAVSTTQWRNLLRSARVRGRRNADCIDYPAFHSTCLSPRQSVARISNVTAIISVEGCLGKARIMVAHPDICRIAIEDGTIAIGSLFRPGFGRSPRFMPFPFQ